MSLPLTLFLFSSFLLFLDRIINLLMVLILSFGRHRDLFEKHRLSESLILLVTVLEILSIVEAI